MNAVKRGIWLPDADVDSDHVLLIRNEVALNRLSRQTR